MATSIGMDIKIWSRTLSKKFEIAASMISHQMVSKLSYNHVIYIYIYIYIYKIYIYIYKIYIYITHIYKCYLSIDLLVYSVLYCTAALL